MKIIYSIILVLAMSSISWGAVGNDTLKEIKKLIEQGKYEEALQKHIWFHEESKTSSGMGGVRLSYALKQWAELGEKFPKAKQALIELAEKQKAKLLTGEGDFDEMAEYESIWQYLKNENKGYELFLEIHSKHPTEAKSCFFAVEREILKNKNYKLYGIYMGDPVVKYEEYRNSRERMLGSVREHLKTIKSEVVRKCDEGVMGTPENRPKEYRFIGGCFYVHNGKAC